MPRPAAPFTLSRNSSRIGAVVAVSSDGLRVIAGSDDAAAREWDVASGRKIKDYVHDLGGGPVSAVAFSQDRRLVATAHDAGFVRVWNTESGELVRTVKGEDQAIVAVALSPDAKRLLSYTTAGAVNVWEVASGRPIRSQKHAGETSVLAFWTDWKRARVCCGDAIVTFDVMAPRTTRAAISCHHQSDGRGILGGWSAAGDRRA